LMSRCLTLQWQRARNGVLPCVVLMEQTKQIFGMSLIIVCTSTCSASPCKQVQYPAAVDAMWFKEVCRSETDILQQTHSTTEVGIGQDNSDEELSEHILISENLSREEYIDRQQNIPEEVEQQQNTSEEISDDATAAIIDDASSHSVYWDSTNAKNLFGAHPDDRNAHVMLKWKIQKLKAGTNQMPEGYRDLIHGNDPNDACTPYQIYEICQQCSFLCVVYIYVMEQMHDGKTTWESCCCQLCKHLNLCGIQQTKNWQVIKKWNQAFHQKECFKHPNPPIAHGKLPDPPFLEAFPWIKRHIRNFCLADLANLSIDKVQNYRCHTKMYAERWCPY